MYNSLCEEGVLALARLAPYNARGSLVNADADPQGRRTALSALLVIPWERRLVREVGTHNLFAVFSAAAPRLHLSHILLQLRQAIFELWHSDLT